VSEPVKPEQARPPAIMWVSKPMTRPDRRACLLIIPIPAAAHAAAPAALTSDQCRSLLEDLAQLADPRQRRGRRHALVGVLGVAVCAVLAGARSLVAIAEWAADAERREAPWNRAEVRDLCPDVVAAA
jgi:hypothetical protein